MRGSELTAYMEHGGIVRKEVWAVKILPEENKVEVHTKEDDEPETFELDNFLETWDRKIEIINRDYLDHICDEPSDADEG